MPLTTAKASPIGKKRAPDAVVEDLAQHLEAKLPVFRKAFDTFRAAGDAPVMAASSLLDALEACEIEPEHEHRLVAAAGRGDSEYGLTFDQFIELAMLADAPPENDGVLEAFRSLDGEAKGVVSRDALRKVLSGLAADIPPHEADAMLEAADRRRNGRVNYRELYKSHGADQ